MEQTFDNGKYSKIRISTWQHSDGVYIDNINVTDVTDRIALDRTTALELAQYILDNYSQPKQ